MSNAQPNPKSQALRFRVWGLIGNWGLVIGVLLILGVRFYNYNARPVPPKFVTVHSRGLMFIQGANAGLPEYCRVSDLGTINQQATCAKSIPVRINDGGVIREIPQTQAQTVGILLDDLEIPLASTDQVRPSMDTYLAPGLEIAIDRIVDLEKVEQSQIDFQTQEIKDSAMLYGRESIEIKGAAGKLEKTFLVTYKNGIEIRRRLLAQQTLQAAVTEVKRVGTKIEIEETRQGQGSWYATKRCLPASSADGCAASPYWPKGRFVRVNAVNSGKSVIVKINDFGPDQAIHPDRVIDLDVVAYRLLAPIGSGTINVRLELLKN